MRGMLFLVLLVSFAACKNSSKTKEVLVTDSAVTKVQPDSSSNYIHRFSDTVLENKITTALLKLPFVIKSNNYIDSFSNHRHSMAFMLDSATAWLLCLIVLQRMKPILPCRQGIMVNSVLKPITVFL